MTAADVGDLGAGLELGFDAVERRDPRRHEVAEVAGLEQSLGAVEQVVAVLVPSEALAGLEGLADPLLVLVDRRGDRHRPARNAGVESSASTAACSSVRWNSPVAGS